MSYNPEEARAVSILDVLKATLRHWILIPGLFALGLMAGLGILATSKPTYQTMAKILLERRDVPYRSGTDTQNDAPIVIDERYVEDQTAVMGTDDFAKSVVKKLGLDTKQSTPNPPGSLKKMLIGWGFSDDKSKLTPEQTAVLDQATVFAPTTSNVLSVRVTAPDPQGAADLANAMADTYVENVTGSDNPDQKRVRDWLSSQITELRKKVAESEAAAENFRANAGLLKGTNSTLGTEQISAINANLTAAESAETEAVAKAKAVRALLAQRGSIDSAPEVSGSPVIQQLQQQRISANRMVSELSATYLSNHPKLIAAKQQVNEIDKQIRSESLKIVEGLDSQANLAKARTKSLRDSMDRLKKTESTANLEDVQLKALERESTANRQLLETLLARYVEINTRQDLDVKATTARVIQRADVPSFVHFPRKGPILLLTSLGGLALGFGLSFLMEIAKAAGGAAPMRQKVQSARRNVEPANPQVTEQAAVRRTFSAQPTPPPPVQAEPVLKAAPPVTASAVTDMMRRAEGSTKTEHSVPNVMPDVVIASKETESESIADELKRFHKAGFAANVAFARVGSGPLESALAVATASRELAKIGNRCLVIDLDMERAELERLFELLDGPGLLDLLAGRSDFSRLICRDAASTVQIIRLGDPANAPSQEALSQRLQSILNSLQGIYDYIFIHTGKATPESLSLVTLADVAVLVSPPSHDAQTVAFMQKLREKSPMEVVNLSVEDPKPADALV
jgi:polysaccharide biosynthesis transport protein